MGRNLSGCSRRRNKPCRDLHRPRGRPRARCIPRTVDRRSGSPSRAHRHRSDRGNRWSCRFRRAGRCRRVCSYRYIRPCRDHRSGKHLGIWAGSRRRVAPVDRRRNSCRRWRCTSWSPRRTVHRNRRKGRCTHRTRHRRDRRRRTACRLRRIGRFQDHKGRRPTDIWADSNGQTRYLRIDCSCRSRHRSCNWRDRRCPGAQRHARMTGEGQLQHRQTAGREGFQAPSAGRCAAHTSASLRRIGDRPCCGLSDVVLAKVSVWKRLRVLYSTVIATNVFHRRSGPPWRIRLVVGQMQRRFSHGGRRRVRGALRQGRDTSGGGDLTIAATGPANGQLANAGDADAFTQIRQALDSFGRTTGAVQITSTRCRQSLRRTSVQARQGPCPCQRFTILIAPV